MGIKYFFGFMKKHFGHLMYKMPKKTTVPDLEIYIDNLMIDMNGVFHNSAQKVYEYGNFKPPRRLMGRRNRRKVGGLKKQLELFAHVCQTIEDMVDLVQPKKRLVLCVDGSAPLAKQNQQRQRRFRSAKETGKDAPFETSSITPGTKFMDYLSKYIDWYIRKRISEDKKWQAFDVLFSNEKAPGEGEHKCFLVGTLILLWNGSIKAVEDIKVGDRVIGDDGTPRTVTDLVSGEDEMFEIIQNNAENYTVNKGHILTLQIADHKRIYWSEKEGAWVTGWYDRTTNRYRRRQFSGLREDEKPMTDKDRTCEECKYTYSTRENYAKHMKKHDINVLKMKTGGRTIAKTKEEALEEANSFLKTIDDSNILDISVADYLKIPKNTQRRLYGFRCSGVDWPSQKIDIDPYLLGLWLGDGDCRHPTICTVDDEVVQFLTEYCDENDFKLTNSPKYITYRICETKQKNSRIISWLNKYNLIQNKHIPRVYLVNDRKTRLELLAGIIDADGNVTTEGRLVRIAQCLEHKQMVDDIVDLSRSLGFCTNVRTANTTHMYNGEKRKGKCYQITISGDLHTIPTLIARKQCSTPPTPGEKGRSIVIDKLRTSIRVKPIGRDKYYGFNTDGNHRFLLRDFTVTHNCIQFIRMHGLTTESYCINGLDADLFMLALGTHMPKFYILREDLYDHKNEYHMVDIGSIRGELADLLYWESDDKKYVFDERTAIDDFIAMGFLVGNDFLPHVPSIEIIEKGIELMINVYQQSCESYGHLTSHASGRVILRPKVLKVFLGTLGFNEKENFENKLRKKNFHPDHLLLSCSKQDKNGDWEVDIEQYNEVYHKERFPEGTDIKKICHDYFEGVQWVLSYYTRGVPNWKWMFPYHYAPSASMLAQHVDTFKMPQYGRTQPTTPFQQLLCVLPPKCAHLIPKPLDTLLTSETSPLREYCPEDFKIDLAGVGKGREWAGIVILPMVDFKVMLKSYFANITKVDKRDLKRNVHGRSFIYRYEPTYTNPFRSYYGNIAECKVRTVMIDL